MATRLLRREQFQQFLELLVGQGYRCVGPRVRDGAIVFDELTAVDHLPTGMVDDQAPGRYRLRDTGSSRWFEWATGPQAIKPLTFAPRETLWRAQRDAQGAITFTTPDRQAARVAVIGVRGCDLAALALQDQHFLGGIHPDPAYRARREALFIVAVHCARSAATCFCVSTGDGPAAQQGYDLVLGELEDRFTLAAGSDIGARVLDELVAAFDLPAADPSDEAAVTAQVEQAAASQSRVLPGRDLRAGLAANLDHPQWDDVAARCLACGNCTSVCPTCFCHREADVPELAGAASDHQREWDSCFSGDHGYIAGWNIRQEPRYRYQQWLTHKLGAWHDQYGRSGCVGCGRCIAWCPTGIDITDEAALLGVTPAAEAGNG